MSQWRKSQKADVLLLAEFQKLRFRQIRIWFDLDRSPARIRGVFSTARGGTALLILPNGPHSRRSAYFNSKFSHFVNQRGTR